jgi:DNA-binding transcriptional LysR family regulator
MNLASLRYLVALSEHRHFARAAQACHITQPALSNALRALEAEFGTEIVRRGRTYAGLTAEGERILLSARRMLHEHEQLQQELVARSAEPQGKLRLGVVPTAMPVAAHFAARLREAHPGISVVVRSSSSQEIENGLQDLTLDMGLGFMERLGGHRRFDVVPQYEERYFLLRRAPGPGLVIGPACGWKEAARLALCLLTPEMHHRQIVDNAFAQAAVEVRPAMETNSISALVLGVAGGELCSVVPGALAATAPAGIGLQALPLVRPSVATPVGFLVLAKATPSRVLQAGLELVRSPAWLKDVQARTGRLSSFKD